MISKLLPTLGLLFVTPSFAVSSIYNLDQKCTIEGSKYSLIKRHTVVETRTGNTYSAQLSGEVVLLKNGNPLGTFKGKGLEVNTGKKTEYRFVAYNSDGLIFKLESPLGHEFLPFRLQSEVDAGIDFEFEWNDLKCEDIQVADQVKQVTELLCVGTQAPVRLTVQLEHSPIGASLIQEGKATINGLNGMYKKKDTLLQISAKGNPAKGTDRAGRVEFIDLELNTDDANRVDPIGSVISNEKAGLGRVDQDGNRVLDQTLDQLKCERVVMAITE